MQNISFLQAIQSGVAAAHSQWRVALLVYLLQLALVATIGLQVYQVFDASIGQSMELERLRTNYDHTVISDFLKIHGASITPLLGQVRWLLVLWLVCSAFLQGGLIWCAVNKPKQAQLSQFWQAGARCFAPFFGIGLVFLLMALLITALLLVPILPNFEVWIRRFESEVPFVWMVAGAVALLAMFYMLLFAWSVHSRLEYMRLENSGVLKAIGAGWRRLRGSLGRTWLILAFALVLTALATAAYALLSGWLGGSLLVVFALQQVFVYFRVLVRVGAYGAL